MFLAPLVQEQYWIKQKSKHQWEMRPFPTVLAQGEEGEDFRAVLWQVSVGGECWHARRGRVCRRWRHPGFSQSVPSCTLAMCSASPAESHCLCFHQSTNLTRRRQLPAAPWPCSLVGLWCRLGSSPALWWRQRLGPLRWGWHGGSGSWQEHGARSYRS